VHYETPTKNESKINSIIFIGITAILSVSASAVVLFFLNKK